MLSDMQVFNQYVLPATVETLAQQIEKFNAASNGAIRLSTTGFDGDFLQEAFFASVASAQRRVDRYASNTTASTTSLAQTKHSSVKVAGGFGPILFEPSQMSYMRQNPAVAAEVASRNFAAALLADQLNTAIAALVAALSNNSSATNDVSATTAMGYIPINDAHALFGDRSGALVAQVMNGTAYHKLIKANLTNTPTLFQAANVTVVDILGKPVIVTDAPALYTAGTNPKLRVLSLADSAAIVSDAGDIISNVQTNNGKLRIETTVQMDYTFGLGLKGYTWDESSGGKSPTDAELATGSNWDQTATSVKDTAGVITITNAS